MDMTNADRNKAYTVIAGPYKGITGVLVPAADVRGVVGRAYIESALDGMVYEVSPKHIRCDGRFVRR